MHFYHLIPLRTATSIPARPAMAQQRRHVWLCIRCKENLILFWNRVLYGTAAAGNDHLIEDNKNCEQMPSFLTVAAGFDYNKSQMEQSKSG